MPPTRLPNGTGATWRARLIAIGLALAPLAYFWRGTIGWVLLAPVDGLIYSFPLRLLAAQQVQAGEWPLWNPFVFSGFPLFAQIQTATLYPGNWLFYVLSPVAAMNWQMLSTYSVASLGTYAYVRLLGCPPFAAAFGGLTFALGGFLVAHLGHVATPQGAAWLPWLLWSLERMRGAARFRYVLAAATALALALCAGHPPIPMYLLMVGGLYVAWFGLATVPPIGRVRYLALSAAAVAAWLGLTAVQLLPAAELAAQSVRAELSFTAFVSYSLPWMQLPSLLFPYFFGGNPPVPYWGAWNLAELTGYVGIAPLMLAVAAVVARPGDRHTAFWAAMAALGVLLALGDGTPLSRVMYYVPVYNLFRAQARNLLIVDFAVAVLAALALRAPRPPAMIAGATLVGAVALLFALSVVSVGREALTSFAALRVGQVRAEELVLAAVSVRNPALLLPLALVAAAGTIVVALARRPSPARGALLLAMQGLDLFVFGELMGQPMPSALDILRPPTAAEAVRTALAPTPGARAALVTETATATDYRWGLWGVPLINGYDPFMLARYGELAGGMPYWGQLAAGVVARQPRFLDLLAVRALLLPPEGGRAGGGLGLQLGPGEAVEFSPGHAATSSAVEVVSCLGNGAALADGEAVARLTLWSADGARSEVLLRVGDHTAEWAWVSAGAAVHHRRAAVAELPVVISGGDFYRGRLLLANPMVPSRLRFEVLSEVASLRLHQVALVSAGGVSQPLSGADLLRGDPGRWRLLKSTADFALFENRRARPRAWLVGETVGLPPAAVLDAVRSGHLADGRLFDPAEIALVEDGPGRDRGPLDPQAAVVVVADTPNSIELRSHASTPTFLVLSEIDYPGWSATVDGHDAPIVRTNYVLRGIELPAGQHRIELVLRPNSLHRGATITATTAALLLAVAMWSVHRREL